eukprot:CAMPEP_0197912282 /NCGR_PEP_ID=MMETSP1439-20131203/74468_1 /TAXON_ID=66791 /ORGANISM="Gonyaulax spinifera, Strain CCMP409" /LENGTH=260 /DNA_ID=CAMNT_0043534059 /DNA_START=70 /DNA_END=852 /DNA_ORIENTATION=-
MTLSALIFAGCAAFATGDARSSFLGTPLIKTAKTVPQVDLCKCDTWRSVYQERNVTCGSTNEFYSVRQSSGLNGEELNLFRNNWGSQFCAGFYKRLQDNTCANINLGKDEGQWCYVSSGCKDLNGGSVTPGARESWKKCGEKDAKLRNYTPEELAALAKTADLDLGMLHKMAYPLHEGHLWNEVASFWEGGEPIPEKLEKEMQAIADSGKPYSFDTRSSKRSPHRIVVGKKVYAVEPTITLGQSSPGTQNTLACIKGCDW